MSAWKLAVREIHALGGSVPWTHVIDIRDAIKAARRYGLVSTTGGRGRGQGGTWSLTSKGVDYCEGRLVPVGKSHTPMRFEEAKIL